MNASNSTFLGHEIFKENKEHTVNDQPSLFAFIFFCCCKTFKKYLTKQTSQLSNSISERDVIFVENKANTHF
jgi:hypothetical protein